VRVNDFAFGLHATVLCIITVSQFWSRLWGWTPLAQRPRPTNVTFAVLCCSGVIVLSTVFMVLFGAHPPTDRRERWEWIDLVSDFLYALQQEIHIVTLWTAVDENLRY
jgi:cystinosin